MTIFAHKRSVLLLGILVLVISIATFANAQPSASGYTISGYAWSDTIGWIDLSCTNSDACSLGNWGFVVNDSGVLTGYAWSEHIGWVSANSGDLSGCPAAPCSATASGDNLHGWLRALSADGNGWDGWISISGSSPNYGPVLSGDNFSGFSWGSDVVGWVDWSYARRSGACVPNGTLQCSNSTTVVDSCGNEVSVCAAGLACSAGVCVETCVNDAACPATHYCPGTTPAACTVLNCPAGQHVLNHRCVCDSDNLPQLHPSHPGGFCPVNCAEGLMCQGGDLYYRDASCALTLSESCNHGCDANACLPPAATVTLSANPSLVQRGGTAQVTWNSSNTTSCTVTGTNGDSWSDLSGSETSRAINGQTIFRITCVDLRGASVVKTTTVIILPEESEV